MDMDYSKECVFIVERDTGCIKVEESFDTFDDYSEIGVSNVNIEAEDIGKSTIPSMISHSDEVEGCITIVPHKLSDFEDDSINLVDESPKILELNANSLPDEISPAEIDKVSEVHEENDIQTVIKEETEIEELDFTLLRANDSIRSGITDLTDELPNKRSIKIDKADPRSRLHFIKYLKKTGRTLKIWECGICGKEFFQQYVLMRHLPTHTDERKYKCGVCGKAFRQMSTLAQHKPIHSQSRNYTCDICQKTFSRGSTLISHKKTHTEKKPYQCNICGKAFHQKGNLKNHLFTHTNERPYKCNICGKGFNQSSNLHCHQTKVHVPTSASNWQSNEKYKCSQCNSSFSRKAQLKQHEEYHHGENKDSFSSKNNCLRTTSFNKASLLSRKKIGNVQIIQLPNGDKPFQESKKGLLIDPIDTKAMHKTLSSGKTPFALLKTICGPPVILKVQIATGGKHMLVTASSSEIKAAGKFVIKEGKGEVEAKIPIVATICQKVDAKGQVHLEVNSPYETSTPIISENNEKILSSSVKSSIDKLRNTITQQFNLSPSIVKNYAKNSVLISEDEVPSTNLSSSVGVNYSHHLGGIHNEVGEATLFNSSVDLVNHDDVSLKDDILDIEGAVQYLRPTGVIGEYEVIDSSNDIVTQESIIHPIKTLLEDTGYVAVDQSQLTAFMDVLQNAGMQLHTISNNHMNGHQVVLKTDSEALIVNDQLVLTEENSLNVENVDEEGFNLVIQEAVIQQ